MDYSIQGTTNFMNKKIKLFNKADNFDYVFNYAVSYGLYVTSKKKIIIN